MDPEVKKYFIKILNSFTYGLLWMLTFVTAGLYFGFAIIIDSVWHWYNFIFYISFVLSFLLLLRYYYRSWKGYKFIETE